MQGAQSLARLLQELAVCVHVKVYESVVQVPDGLVLALQPHQQHGVLVAISGDFLGKTGLCKGIAPYHEVLCGECLIRMLPPVICRPQFGGCGLVCPSEFASLWTVRGVLHAAVIYIGRMLGDGIKVVLQKAWAVYLCVAVKEKEPLA